MFGLEGKVALVSGGSRGIGRAIALDLARAGAAVVVNFRQAHASADKVVQEIVDGGHRALAVQADVAVRTQVEKMFTRAIEEFGRINIVVSNAAIFAKGVFAELTQEEWDGMLKTNLGGCFNVCQEGVRHMLKQGRGGRIVTVSSVSGHRAQLWAAHYCAAKAGIENLTRAIATDYARDGITANCIAAGATFTDINKDVYTPKVIEQLERRIPVGHVAQPTEISPIAVFFASEEAGYVTGQVVEVDGGLGMDCSIRETS